MKDLNTHEAQGKLVGLETMITTFFSKTQEKVKVKDLPYENSGLNAAGRRVMTLFQDLTVQEAATMLRNMGSAIEFEREKLSRDKIVSDLNIQLLEPDEKN